MLVVGGEGLIVALTELGLRPVMSADEEPAAVVQGFSPQVGWQQLAEGAYALARGLPWVASNIAIESDMLAPGAMPMPPTWAASASET